MGKKVFKNKKEMTEAGYGHLLNDCWLTGASGLTTDNFDNLYVYVEHNVLTVAPAKGTLDYEIYAPLRFDAKTGDPMY